MRRICACVAVFCWVAGISTLQASCGMALAQDAGTGKAWPFLPLAVGNRWEYLWLSNGVWSKFGAVIEVKDKVKIQVVSPDSASPREEEYYGVYFTAGNGLFPGGDPACVIYARQDADGNIWAGGTTAYNGKIEPLDGEQPWWMRNQDCWKARLGRKLPPYHYGRLDFGPDGMVSVEADYRLTLCDPHAPYMSLWDETIVARVRQMLPSFEWNGPWRFAWFGATDAAADTYEVNAFFIAGLGPFVVAPVPGESDAPYCELQLVRAVVGGTEYVLPRETAVQANGWGFLKGRPMKAVSAPEPAR